MHTRLAPRLAVAALLLAIACTPSGPAALNEADKTALRAIDQRFAEAVLAKNWAGAAAVYTTEASLMQRGTYAMTFTLPGAPGPTEDRGKYLLIERKQADGSWLITNEMFNSDVPLPQSN